MPGKKAYKDVIAQKYQFRQTQDSSDAIRNSQEFRQKLNNTKQGVKDLILSYNGISPEFAEGRSSSVIERS